MQFLITSIVALTAAVTAMPAAELSPRQATVCSGTYNTAQCCAVDVLGLADLQCVNPPGAVTTQTQFVDECAAMGQEARCCILPVLGQALLCGAPLMA